MSALMKGLVEVHRATPCHSGGRERGDISVVGRDISRNDTSMGWKRICEGPHWWEG